MDWRPTLQQQIVHYVSVHVQEAEVSTLVSIREFLVVDSQQIHDRCVHVMDANRARRPLVDSRLGLQRSRTALLLSCIFLCNRMKLRRLV